MEMNVLRDYSPVRFFDSTSAGLKAGQMGLITSKKGLGKTSVLVQFAIDSLLEEKSVVHVSFDQKSSNVISWYSSILAEICKKRLVKVDEVSEEIMKNRTILNFNQDNFKLPKVVNTIKSLKDGGIEINAIVVDGLDLAKTDSADLDVFRKFVESEKMTAWFSFTNEADTLEATLESDKLNCFETVAHIASAENQLSLAVLKNGTGKVLLDEKTLLMTK